MRISVERIEQAAHLIDPVFLNSPQLEFEPLSRLLGAQTVLKIETLNPIRCFKGRGTDFLMQQIPPGQILVAASAGNFGQGLAFAARKRGIPLSIFAATNANRTKLDRMRDLGAQVILEGHDFDASKQAAREYAARAGHRFIEDGLEPAITEGAGTMAVELLRLSGHFDSVLVALGNGASLIGVGAWIKAHSPATQVIGVSAAAAPAMEISWREHRVATTPMADTIADGIAVRIPVPEALNDMRGTVDDVLLVTEDAIRQGMQQIAQHTGLLVEPSGAVGIAAIQANAARFKGQRVATILCGSNL